MIALRVKGGLGNQMFQYAVAFSLSEMGYGQILIDERHLDKDKKRFLGIDKFCLKKKNNSLYRLLKTIYFYLFSNSFKLYKEENLSFDRRIFNLKSKNVILEGYFQSEKYFSKYKEELVECFRPTNISPELSNLIVKIESPPNSIALHVRRGDYVSDEETRRVHGDICSEKYFRDALNKLTELTGLKVSEFKVFIFTDDLEWVKDNKFFSTVENTLFVPSTLSPAETIYLMSHAKHFVISNSSFSWWGAWLSKRKGKVISPKRWFNESEFETDDRVPEKWIRI